MNNPKVAVVYHYIAHYRKPVFDALCRNKKIDYFVVADTQSNIASLPVLDSVRESCGDALSARWIHVKNCWIAKHFLWQQGVLKIAGSEEYDAVVFLGNMYFLSTWIAVLLAKHAGKGVYFWTHGVRRRECGVKGAVRRLFYRLADGLLLYGERAKRLLVAEGFSPEHIHVIWNSLDFDKQNSIFNEISDVDREVAKSAIGVSGDDKVVVAIGRLTRDKRFDLLIQAAQLIRHNIKFKLVIIGDGPERARLEEDIFQNKLGDIVSLYGACYDERVIATLVSAANVSVVPGDIGLSAIHSLTYGTPVVTHDCFDSHKPEFEAIVDGVSGSFYKQGDVEDLGEKVVYWLKQDRTISLDACRNVIRSRYNPHRQNDIISRVILGDAWD